MRLLAGNDLLRCPACFGSETPSDVAVDGLLKLHHYHLSRSKPCKQISDLDGRFFIHTSQVLLLRNLLIQAANKTSAEKRTTTESDAQCGETHWTASKSAPSNRPGASTRDVGGINLAVCRHGIPLKAVSIPGAETFIDSCLLQLLFIQKEKIQSMWKVLH